MRIIRGKFKTRKLGLPKGFPSRPTTDFAKEGLFNVLEHQLYLEDLNILDLCAGTGSITLEFLSREAGKVVAVDRNYNCVRHIVKMGKQYDCMDDLNVVKSDLLKYLRKTTDTFDLIIADPPYVYEHHAEIAAIVFERNLLKEDGILIIEHGKETKLESITHFDILRTYGNVNFSFFKINEDAE
ncbi:MAG: 16S rRNA (guanine(966)-N(2))-methyltransferase RsmD [Crocinitomicaceae bacterium]|nr:16S rRNA (guanine(966)-N(2))-methyltransferase RsmD [Crocinitomicaceae bacterium]